MLLFKSQALRARWRDLETYQLFASPKEQNLLIWKNDISWMSNKKEKPDFKVYIVFISFAPANNSFDAFYPWAKPQYAFRGIIRMPKLLWHREIEKNPFSAVVLSVHFFIYLYINLSIFITFSFYVYKYLNIRYIHTRIK